MIVSTLANSLSQTGSLAPWLLLSARRSAAGSEAGGEMVVWLVVAAAAIAGVCGGLCLAHRWWDRYRRQSHAALFQGLCEAQDLDAPARRLLVQVGRHHRLAQLARLFTEPQWLDPSGLGGPLETRAAELAALRTRLFSVEALKR